MPNRGMSFNRLRTAQLGCLFGLTGKASNAIQMLTTGIAAFRSTGSTPWIPIRLAYLAMAHAELGNFDDAWRCVAEAMSTIGTTKETWYEAEVHRMTGEVALKSPEPDALKAQAYFGRALMVARHQQAKSWELRAAMSLARLWRDQARCGKRANCWLRFTAGSLRASTRAI